MAPDSRTVIKELINACHERLPSWEHDTFTVPALAGEVWVPLSKIRRPQTLGDDFAKAVAAGEFRGVEFSHVQRSPRKTVWRKVVAGRE